MDWKELVIVDSPVPAPGAEWIVTLPAGSGPWRIASIAFQLAASAAAANREVILTVDQGGGATTALVPSGITHLANESRVYTFQRGSGYRGAGAQSLHVVTSIGPLYVSGTGRIRSQTMNIQAADQFSAARLWIERVFR